MHVGWNLLRRAGASRPRHICASPSHRTTQGRHPAPWSRAVGPGAIAGGIVQRGGAEMHPGGCRCAATGHPGAAGAAKAPLNPGRRPQQRRFLCRPVPGPIRNRKERGKAGRRGTLAAFAMAMHLPQRGGDGAVGDAAAQTSPVDGGCHPDPFLWRYLGRPGCCGQGHRVRPRSQSARARGRDCARRIRTLSQGCDRRPATPAQGRPAGQVARAFGRGQRKR